MNIQFFFMFLNLNSDTENSFFLISFKIITPHELKKFPRFFRI
jgi:hypothetical protein